jgi:hypothetical protein
MRLKHLALLLFTLPFLKIGNCQILNEYLPGRIILLNGDTLSGKVKAFAYEDVVKAIQIKSDNQDPKEIPIKDIYKIRFKDGVQFQTSIFNEQRELFYLLVDSENDFLKKDDLNKKTRYYLLTPDSLQELRYDTIFEDENDFGRTNKFEIRVYPDFKLKLRKEYEKCINTKGLKLYENQLKNRIHQANRCKGFPSIQSSKRKPVIRAGLQYAQSLPTMQNPFEAYEVAFHMNFTFPEMSRKFSFQTYIKQNYWYEDDLKDSERTKVGLGAQYRLFTGKFQPFFSLNINTPFRVNYGFGMDTYVFEKHALRILMEREIFYIRFHMVGLGYVYTL